MSHLENPYKVFHSPLGIIRKKMHFVLVRPEEPGNVGSVARAMENMGIKTPLRIVGSPDILTEKAFRLAKHAGQVLRDIKFFPDLSLALKAEIEGPALTLATSAEVGSPLRPHPIWAREAVNRTMEKLKSNEISHCLWVFGPEGDGLLNEEVSLCDWLVTIPSTPEYRSLNLAQATLVFCYEINMALLQAPPERDEIKPGQKQRLVSHMLKVAEEVGFILPGDPFKMRAKLDDLFSGIPNHVKEVRTLHGLLDQISRSVKKGFPDVRGRYGHAVQSKLTQVKEVQDGIE